MSAPVLAPGVTALLEEISIGADGRSVRLGPDREVTGDTTKELRGALSTALYERWHAGISPTDDEQRRRSPRRDHDLETLLGATVPHATSPTEVTVGRSAVGPDGPSVLVEVQRVRVGVPLSGPSGPLLRAARPGDTVTLPFAAVRPAVSPGFLLVSGSAGGPAGGDILRFYVHVADPGRAPAVWGAVLAELEREPLPYRAKVLSRRVSYPRRDAVVVYLDSRAWSVLPRLVETAVACEGLSPSTSALAHALAPGVAVAWDPRDPRPGWERMSFGQHRGAAIAEAVAAYATREGRADGSSDSVVDLVGAVTASLLAAGADPAAPYRNLTSPELPPARLVAGAGVAS